MPAAAAIPPVGSSFGGKPIPVQMGRPRPTRAGAATDFYVVYEIGSRHFLPAVDYRTNFPEYLLDISYSVNKRIFILFLIVLCHRGCFVAVFLDPLADHFGFRIVWPVLFQRPFCQTHPEFF